MGFTVLRPLRRIMIMLSLSALAVASIVLTAPAAAVTFSCNRFTSGGVTFSVCIGKAAANTAKPR